MSPLTSILEGLTGHRNRRGSRQRNRLRNWPLMVEPLEVRALLNGTWATGTPLLNEQRLAVDAVMADQFYVVGGQIGGQGSSTTFVEAYNPSTATWTQKASDLLARTDAAGDVIDGTLYVVGGWFGADSNSSTNQLTIYDSATDSWSMGASAARLRGDGAAVAIGGKL